MSFHEGFLGSTFDAKQPIGEDYLDGKRELFLKKTYTQQERIWEEGLNK